MNKIDRCERFANIYRRFLVLGSRLLYGIDPDKVVFCCFQGRAYGDNPRCISERLHLLRPETRIVWLLTRAAEKRFRERLPDYVKPVFYKTKEAFWELATARVWVDNFTKHRCLTLSKGRQFYVQTWHGDRAIKKICYDMNLPEDGRRIEEKCSRVLTGSAFGEEMFRTAFRYRGEYIKAGCPRNDRLVRNDPEDIRMIREKLRIASERKVLLYAPTYREEERSAPKRTELNLERVLDCLEKKTGKKWICLFRAHYLSKGLDIGEERRRFINMSDYEDMAELMLASDLLLTDYSSAALDYIILDRPALFYIADWEEYAVNRGVYVDVREAPIMTASNQEELETLIRALSTEKVKENCAEIKEYFGYYESGNATDAACSYIIERLGNRKRMPD